MNEMKK